MLSNSTQNIRKIAINFLEKSREERGLLLKEFGIARYEFLTEIPLTEANIICVMRFLQTPSQLKFPILIGVDLSGLILTDVNFIRGNLTDANLRGTSLVNADLIFANLTNADLRDADLRGSTLNETIWTGTLVDGCFFGEGIGLTASQRKDLQKRGAIFSASDDDV
jgi:uncharacterized protein YjbI with pentapeptide repeats